MANYALEFDGASGLVTVADATSIQNIFDDGGTIECWINADSDGEGDNGAIVSKGTGWFLLINNESASKAKIQFYHYFSGVNGSWISTSTEITINTDTHIVATYQSDAIANNPIIYVNASPVTLTELGTPTGTRDTDVGSDLIIGNFAADGNTFDGKEDETRLYKNRIMGQAEVTANYNGGAGRQWPFNRNNLVAWWPMDEGSGSYIYDKSGNGNTGTITTATFATGFEFKPMVNVPRG